MGFPTPLTTNQKATTRASGYWQRTFCAFNPGEIVFQCEANEDITDTPFKAFQWTNTLEGAYTDVWQGLVVFISSTSDYLKDYKYRGRVRLAPSATEFRIDLNATTLATGDIITVIRDADLNAVVREADLADGSITYHNLPPMTTGLPSVLVGYDADNDGIIDWTPAQTGIATASGASISSYAWAVSGVGSSSISNPAVQNPDFTFEAGFHYLVRLTTTDSNGVSNFILMQVYAITRTFSAPVIVYAVAGNISQDLDNGYTGSITAYTGVANLPYRTHAVIFAVEHFGDDDSTPINTNVLMHGRLRSESITTEGSAEAGRLMQVTYPIEGITSYMQRLKVPNDIVRQSASPNEWGEITHPTPYRMAVYFLSVYSTLLNLVSFSAGDNLFDAWRVGGEPVSIDGGYALDTLNSLLDRIKASANYAPDGEIRCEILASYTVDRSGLITVMDFLPLDTRSYALDIDTSRNTAQVVGFGGVWNTVNNTFILYTAQSPSIPYGDAPEVREINRELLQYDSTVDEAKEELAARTGNDYAANNPKWLLNPVMRGAHRWMVATGYLRYTWQIAASENTRGVAITTATKWQCQSVNVTINTDGTYDVNPQFVQETEFTDAQSIASLLPQNLEGMNPVLPILSDDPAFPDNPAWAYPTDNPTLDELQPIGSFSGWQGFSPLNPEQAAQAAQKQGSTKCKVAQVNMRNPGTTLSTFVTTLSAAYTLQLSGDGEISGDIWTHHINLVTSNGGLVVNTTLPAFPNPGIGAWSAGVGWIQTTVGGQIGVGISLMLPAPANLLSARIALANVVNPGAGANGFIQNYNSGVNIDTGTNVPLSTGETFRAQAFSGALADQIAMLYQIAALGTMTVQSLTLTGTGTNPYGGTGVRTRADAYYFYPADSTDEQTAQVFAPTAGLLVDGAKPATIPPYSPNHAYTVPYVGTGNPLQLNYALADYTSVQNRLITVQACRNS